LTAVLPGLGQFQDYRRGWLRGDILAGLTVAAYLIPQVMAYAEVAGLSPVVGLWAAIGPLVVYALLGSSRQLSIGPESTTALMTAVVLMPIAAGDPVRYAGAAATLALLVGGLCLLGRLPGSAPGRSAVKPVLVATWQVAVIMISALGKITGVKATRTNSSPRSRRSSVARPAALAVILATALVVSLFTLTTGAPIARTVSSGRPADPGWWRAVLATGLRDSGALGFVPAASAATASLRLPTCWC
jgi:MFS superfamily sulfate permease-like transporter